MARESRLEFLQRELDSQRKWVREHGESLSGYVEHYGSKDDPDHYGDGGEAIYAADKARLDELERQAQDCRPAGSGFAFLDPSEKSAESWRVAWNDRICSPSFNSKGAAEAYIAGLRSGRRPEYSR